MSDQVRVVVPTAPPTEPVAPATPVAPAAAAPVTPDPEAKLNISSEKPAAPAPSVVDLDEVAADFARTGQITDEVRAGVVKALTDAGFKNPENVLESHLKGAQAVVASTRQMAFDAVGGQGQYQTMVAWAAKNLPPAEQAAFNAAVNDPASSKLAVHGLYAQFSAATGNVPAREGTRVASGALSNAGLAPIRSMVQLSEIVSDPKYHRDPGFKAEADARIRASMDAGLLK